MKRVAWKEKGKGMDKVFGEIRSGRHKGGKIKGNGLERVILGA